MPAAGVLRPADLRSRLVCLSSETDSSSTTDAAPQSSSAGGGSGSSSSSGGDDGILPSALNAGLLALWAGLMGYVLFLAPNQTPSIDSFVVQKLVG